METSSAQIRFESLRILVVDDHAINREFLCSGLAPHCARVDSARSGVEAIERCARLEYDLILMDLHMPDQDGLDAALDIRRRGPAGADTPIVFLTADVREEERQRLHSAGFHRVLTKPVSLEVLFRSIRNWLKLESTAGGPPTHRSFDARLLDVDGALAVCNGRADLLTTVQMKLAADLDQRLPVLDEHLREGAFLRAAGLLHQWSGACAYAGAQVLSRRSRTLERALRDEDAVAQAGAYVDFMRCARATAEALREPRKGGSIDAQSG